MRVFDARSSGFWPGEGCGVVVLMRLEDAISQCRHSLRGSSWLGHFVRWQRWTHASRSCRPTARFAESLSSERVAAIEAVGYFEGHGTGTPVGDVTELRTLSQSRRAASPDGPSAAIGSIKANIGHTKAASGVAGFIKATMAVHRQLIPPSTGWETPHPVLADEGDALELLREGKDLAARTTHRWRASVEWDLAGLMPTSFWRAAAAETANGDCHSRASVDEISEQDAELFLLSGRDRSELQAGSSSSYCSYALRLSRSELIDLAAHLAATHSPSGSARAALVASTPAELQSSLETLAERVWSAIATLLSNWSAR